MALKQQSRMMCARMYSNMAVICHVKKVGYKITIVLCFQIYLKIQMCMEINARKQTNVCIFFIFQNSSNYITFMIGMRKKANFCYRETKTFFPPICISFILY